MASLESFRQAERGGFGFGGLAGSSLFRGSVKFCWVLHTGFDSHTRTRQAWLQAIRPYRFKV